ncbi:uncharacterized protein RSE6_03442 [Rhynchosporium secalis]|uniref:Uncharacterized protein n=1 Tax=Rhynchosporium secalis TaxID=38038 RepID=A0A1E1M2S6_RHYSE|nr:uncharacterized protein RSE6_03442 [Rhynchosporium secalis]
MGLFGENRDHREHGLAAKHSVDKLRSLLISGGENKLYWEHHLGARMEGVFFLPEVRLTRASRKLKSIMMGLLAQMGPGLRHRTDIEFLCKSWRVTLLPLSQLVTIVPLQVEGRSERSFPPQRTTENPRGTAQSCSAFSDTGERRSELNSVIQFYYVYG